MRDLIENPDLRQPLYNYKPSYGLFDVRANQKTVGNLILDVRGVSWNEDPRGTSCGRLSMLK